MSKLSDVVDAVADLLRGVGGLQDSINRITVGEGLSPMILAESQVITQNLPVDIAERSTAGKYPSIHVYCDKVTNQLREKSRSFSGDAEVVVEVRVSTDRVQHLDTQLNVLIDAVTTTLDQNRGDWGAGLFYGGAYEVALTGVKHGGKNFTQSAKVTFKLEISRN
jgi:hypothetical protein